LDLSGTNTYGGATSITGGTLLVSGTGSINNTTGVTVNSGTTFRYNSSTAYSGGAITNSGGHVAGSGNLGAIVLGGSGSVDPGNSPGILMAGSTNPTGGLAYNFEYTLANVAPTWNAGAGNSGNDVLQLTGATPFSSSLAAGNVVSLYLGVGTLTAGDVFTGGFFTNNSASFLSSISGATYNYYLLNGSGSVSYNGLNYDAYTGPLTFTLNTVQVPTANFTTGTVANGYVMQFTATSTIPEPQTYAMMLGGAAMLILMQRRRRKV
jgi:autotransporter-associated beta strand protein